MFDHSAHRSNLYPCPSDARPGLCGSTRHAVRMKDKSGPHGSAWPHPPLQVFVVLVLIVFSGVSVLLGQAAGRHDRRNLHHQ